MNAPYVFKKCTKCGRWLVVSKVNFYKSKNGKYGLDSKCKECVRKDKRNYYEKNKEYYADYRKQNKEYYANYRKQNKELYAEYSKKHYKENKEYYADYRKQNKEHIRQYNKKYREENKEYLKDCKKKYYQSAQGQVVSLNGHSKRRQGEEQRGNGITPDQWLEMMNFFDWKCAYSGVVLDSKNKTIDHIVPFTKDGEHEIWNIVPMNRSLNSSKQDKDINEWYPQQDFYSEDRLNKINEWQDYAYNKWSK